MSSFGTRINKTDLSEGDRMNWFRIDMSNRKYTCEVANSFAEERKNNSIRVDPQLQDSGKA